MDYLRPCFLEGPVREDANGNVKATIKVAKDCSTLAKARTPDTNKNFFKKINPFAPNSQKESPAKQEEFYYPAEASDIDEEDDSDIEGGLRGGSAGQY